MKCAAEQLEAQLASGLQKLYIITGDETLLALEAAELVRARARAQGFSEREVFIVESGFQWGRLLEARQSLSLFAAQRIIDLRIPNGKPGVEGSQTLQRYAQGLPPDVLTLISLPKLDRQTQASAWFEALEKSGVVVSADPVSVERLGAWLRQRLRKQQQDADEAALAFLVDRVQGNLLAAHQEVLKLGLLYPAGTLNLEAVRQAVVDVARFDVFALGEAMLAGDRQRFVRMLDGLRAEGSAGTLVLWAITEEIRALKRVSEWVRDGKPLAVAMRDARVWGNRARLMPTALRRVKPPQLEQLLGRAARADRMLKGVDWHDPWIAMLDLGLALMAKPASATA